MADVKVALEEVKEDSDSGKLPGVTATGSGKAAIPVDVGRAAVLSS